MIPFGLTSSGLAVPMQVDENGVVQVGGNLATGGTIEAKYKIVDAQELDEGVNYITSGQVSASQRWRCKHIAFRYNGDLSDVVVTPYISRSDANYMLRSFYDLPANPVAPDILLAKLDNTDALFSYFGTWATYTNVNLYGGTSKETNTGGSYVIATLNFGYVKVIFYKGASQGNALLEIDSNPDETINMFNPTIQYQQSYESNHYEYGEHTFYLFQSTNYCNFDALELWRESGDNVNYVHELDLSGVVLEATEKVGFQVTANAAGDTFDAWVEYERIA